MTASMPDMLQALPWDSNFLGFPVARLVVSTGDSAGLNAAIAQARQIGIRLLYVITNPVDTAAAALVSQAGAWLADRKVTFAKALPAAKPTVSLAAAIGIGTEYTGPLEALAQESGTYSRFRLDPRFAPHVFPQLYSQWLRNSLSGAIARRVLVWRNTGGVEQGLLTLSESNGGAAIGLLAVDIAVRCQGIGQQLVAAAVAQAQAWGYREIQVVTQLNNEAACCFYAKCGFRLVLEEHLYHLWLD